MIIRSKAPLRLGLSGGGTDVSPYCDIYGGAILNVTINMYAYCTIELVDSGDYVELTAADMGKSYRGPVGKLMDIDGNLDLLKGVYNHVFKIVGKVPPCRITTYSDAPSGCGLGSSSTMVVAILKAFAEWFSLPLGDYDMAHKAFIIERQELSLGGGRQDQYAATFGGFNFMEFKKDDIVIVNPLRVKRWITDEFESSLLLYFTGVSRSSAKIIEEQQKNTQMGNQTSINAMHELKENTYDMKNALLRGDISGVSKILEQAWENKKKMAGAITNGVIQEAFDVALGAGALSGKVSGAGGGGFIMFMLDPAKRVSVTNALGKLSGRTVNVRFTEDGAHGWKIL